MQLAILERLNTRAEPSASRSGIQPSAARHWARSSLQLPKLQPKAVRHQQTAGWLPLQNSQGNGCFAALRAQGCCETWMALLPVESAATQGDYGHHWCQEKVAAWWFMVIQSYPYLAILRAAIDSHLAPSSHLQSGVRSQQDTSNQAWRCHSCWYGAGATIIMLASSKCSRRHLPAWVGACLGHAGTSQRISRQSGKPQQIRPSSM